MNPATMYITGQDGNPVLINAADFDPKAHTVWGEETAPVATVEAVPTPEGVVTAPDVPAAPVVTVEAVSTPEGVVTAPDAPAAPVALEMFVTKQSAKKFIVTDRAGTPVEAEGIDPKGYASEAEAWAAIMARNNG